MGIALFKQRKFDEAIVEYREALRLKPDFTLAHFNLGNALRDQGRIDQAITDFREVIRLKPDHAEAHNNLGLALKSKGKRDEALAEFRMALRLNPILAQAVENLGGTLAEQGNFDDAIAVFREKLRLTPNDSFAHYNLGTTLYLVQRHDEAVAEFRSTLHLLPEFAEAHCNLGRALVGQGRLLDGLVALRRGHELGSKNPGWHYPSAEWVRNAEWLVELDRKLPAIVGRQIQPADAAESLSFAQMCYNKTLHEAAARMWANEFTLQPAMADDMNVQNRYNAACAAALAGSGQGKDNPPLDEAAKSKWRKQALDWLKADLAAWSKISDSGPPQAMQSIAPNAAALES